MSVEVCHLTAEHAEAWDAYVQCHDHGTLFHTLMWRDAVEEAFGHESTYLVARDSEIGGHREIVGVFPLVRVTSRFAGRILVSVPYGVYGGALANDAEIQRALLDEAREIADRIGAQWIDIRSEHVQCPDLPAVMRYVTFRKRLPDDPAKVLSEMPRKARAAARQARERYELTSSFDDDQLDTVWDLYSRSMRRLASLNYPARFFEALIRRADGSSTKDSGCRHLVQVVRRKGEPIAGLISFMYRDVMMPYFSGCNDDHRECHPSNYLYLTAMEHGVELGCKVFDFGRTRVDNKGAYDFKRFQGFEPTPLNYQYYVPTGGREPDLTPSNPKMRLARSVWPRLPLSVTRPLGAWLSKSIPG